MIVFVSGTDTHVGKTVVSSALLASARRAGTPCRGIKPIESGCVGDSRHPLDAVMLANAGGHEPDILYRYAAPLAPSAAAAEADEEPPDLDRCAAHVHNSAETLGPEALVVVEGAGGLLVPLAPGQLVVDLVAKVDAPLLIVGRDGLGTINHTASSIEIARNRGLTVLGFVFSATGEVDEKRANANASAIREITGAAYLGRVERLDDFDAATLASAGDQLSIQRYLPMQN